MEPNLASEDFTEEELAEVLTSLSEDDESEKADKYHDITRAHHSKRQCIDEPPAIRNIPIDGDHIQAFEIFNFFVRYLNPIILLSFIVTSIQDGQQVNCDIGSYLTWRSTNVNQSYSDLNTIYLQKTTGITIDERKKVFVIDGNVSFEIIDFIIRFFDVNTLLLFIVKTTRDDNDEDEMLPMGTYLAWRGKFIEDDDWQLLILFLNKTKGVNININKPDAYGDTILLIAANFNASIDVFELLYELGANLDMSNSTSSTAIDTAIDEEHWNIVKWLIEHDVKLNNPIPRGGSETSLTNAIYHDAPFDIIYGLIHSGASISLPNTRNELPLDVANIYAKDNVIELIRETTSALSRFDDITTGIMEEFRLPILQLPPDRHPNILNAIQPFIIGMRACYFALFCENSPLQLVHLDGGKGPITDILGRYLVPSRTVRENIYYYIRTLNR